MLKNYLKVAWKNLIRNQFYSALNIAGLATGLCIGLMILLWVRDERSFDAFHSKAKDIYRLENRVGTGSSVQIWTSTIAPIAQIAKEQLPEVTGFVRLSYNNYYSVFKNGDKVFAEDNIYFTDPSFFSLFDFPLTLGNRSNPFPDAASVILTESTALKYFGTVNVVGKVLEADNNKTFYVSGTVKDFPQNSSIRPDMLFSMEHLREKAYGAGAEGQAMDHDFHQFNYDTYLLLQPGADTKKLAARLKELHLAGKPDDTDIFYLPMPLTKMHLYAADGSDQGIGTVRMFTLIAVIILVIACINYVNICTARAVLRGKEVSIRKIAGAAKTQLFLQFVVETMLLFAIASALGMLLLHLLLPAFNALSGKAIQVKYNDVGIWMVTGLTIAGSLVLSSIYPALLLSSFRPLQALKGKFTTSVGDAGFRKGLVIMQFACSVALIAATLVIQSQLSYMKNKALGYEKAHTLQVGMGQMAGHYEAVKAELLKQPGVLAVTRSSASLVNLQGVTGSSDWPGKLPGQTMMIHPMSIDASFMQFFKMRMQTGRNFTGTPADSAHFILNEAALKEMNLADPIGKPFKLWEKKGTILGIVKDFHFTSLKVPIQPAVFIYQPSWNYQLFVKTTGNDAAKAVAAVERQWKRYNEGFVFSYHFLDESFDRLYKTEQRTGMLFRIFAGIAVVISCLGLFGLAAYTAQVRVKEIGVRKVLGASAASIINLLAADFVKLVLIAIAVAIPIAWYAMYQWLGGFAYRVKLNPLLFVASGCIAVTIAVATVSFQSIRSALANPVDCLREE